MAQKKALQRDGLGEGSKDGLKEAFETRRLETRFQRRLEKNLSSPSSNINIMYCKLIKFEIFKKVSEELEFFIRDTFVVALIDSIRWKKLKMKYERFLFCANA